VADVAIRRWGLGDAALGFAIGFLAQTLAVAIYVAVTGRDTSDLDDLPLTAIALLEVPLWVGLFGWPVWVTRRKGRGPAEEIGLRARPLDAPVGFGIGVAAQAILVPLLYWPIFELFDFDSDDVSAEARDLTDQASGWGVLLLVLIVVIAAPIAEEVFYRGLLLRALEGRLGAGFAVVGSSVLFALTHFQGIQLAALFMFGLLAALLTVRTGRLGPAIFAHMGFNAWTVFLLVVVDT
jgi:membrane protease YdiL (CAAX protease family)